MVGWIRTEELILSGSLMILLSSTCCSSAWNGASPIVSSYSNVPSAYQSASLPTFTPPCALCSDLKFFTPSGVMYSGVPQAVERCAMETSHLARPKSINRMWPSASSITFSGLRSRYAMSSSSWR